MVLLMFFQAVYFGHFLSFYTMQLEPPKPEAIMPQAAWEALLRDAVQGLRPPYTPQALRQWLQATHPQAWAIGASSPPRHHHTGKGRGKDKGRARDSKGHSGKRARRGPK